MFRPATGAHAAVARLELEAGVADIELRNLHFPNGWTLGPADDGVPARNVVFRRTTGARFTIQNGRRITIVGGSYGPSLDAPSQIKTYNPESRRMPVDITVSGVRFHDYSRSDDSVHTECLQVYAGQRVVIRNSRFTRCDGTGALALTTLSGTTLRRVIVENNWFDETGDAYDAVQADGSVRDLLFRYNSATKSVIFTGCEDGPCGPARVVANYLPYNPSLCQSGVGYSHNVLAGGRCGGTDVAVHRLSFVDARGFDLHLTPSSAARCRGARDDFPARDIDGQRRPRRYRADAGADQLTGTPGGPSVPRRCRVR